MQEPRRSPRLAEKRAKELGIREYPCPPLQYQQEHIYASFCLDAFMAYVGILLIAAFLIYFQK